MKNDSEAEKFIVTFICTFASDEPYLSVFEAAKDLPDDIIIFITGDVSKVGGAEQFACGHNVVFKGFLPELEYINLLGNSNCIIDLTTRDDCLVCGAYEALSLGIPMVLSNTVATKDLFSLGTVYTDLDPINISNAILKVKRDYKKLQHDVLKLRNDLQNNWQIQSENLQKEIQIKYTKKRETTCK